MPAEAWVSLEVSCRGAWLRLFGYGLGVRNLRRSQPFTDEGVGGGLRLGPVGLEWVRPVEPSPWIWGRGYKTGWKAWVGWKA